MKKKYVKWTKANNYLICMPLLFILCYEVSGIRCIGKYIVRWLQYLVQMPFIHIFPQKSWLITDWALFFVDYHHVGEYICLATIFIGMISAFILFIITKKAEKKAHIAKGENGFEISILRYLNVNKSDRCYLISGAWGVGKTYMLQEFLDKYYSKTRRKIYRISCFGLSTRKDVINEISKEIENADDSVSSVIIHLIEQLPVIGEFLANLLKKSYGYGTVSSGSIFVFDDFERLASHSSNSNCSYVHPQSINYAGISREEIFKYYFSKIDSDLIQINGTLDQQLKIIDIDKYLSIVGVINEMIEVYRYKVIIVCNTDMLGNQFVSDILRSKLNCAEYTKKVTVDAIDNLIHELINNYIFEEKDKYNILEDFLTSLDMTRIIKYLRTSNLRKLSTKIEAFIVTASIYPTQVLDQSLMSSLLASILILDHYKYDKGNFLAKIPIGMNLSLLDEGTVAQLTQSQSTDEDCRWVGIDIATYWNQNQKKIFNNSHYYAEWKDYAFCSVEKKLAHGDFDLTKENYSLFHICYLINQSATLKYSETEFKWIEYARKLLKKMNIGAETSVESVLTTFEDYLNIYDPEVKNKIFSIIEKECGYKRSSGNSQFAKEYNEHLERNTPLVKTS